MDVRRQLEKLKREYSSQNGLEHETLNGFFKDLENLHTRIGSKRLTLLSENETRAEKQRDFEKVCKESDGESYFLGKANFEKLKAENEKAVEDLQNEAIKDLESIREKLQEYINSCYLLDGAKVDENTTRLLNSGVNLTVAEIERLLNVHQQNATMTRVLCDYADNANLKSKVINERKTLLSTAGEHELQQFDNLSGYVLNMFSDNETWVKAHCNPERIETALEETFKNNENYIFSADKKEA